MDITLPGGLRVEVRYKGYAIMTDQPREAGGDGSAPSPFDLFIASIGACAGYYALDFCRARNIKTDGMTLKLDTDYNRQERRVEKVAIAIRLPAGFPPQYHEAIVKAVESCAVKKHIQNPPKFQVDALAEGIN